MQVAYETTVATLPDVRLDFHEFFFAAVRAELKYLLWLFHSLTTPRRLLELLSRVVQVDFLSRVLAFALRVQYFGQVYLQWKSSFFTFDLYG